MRKSFKQTAALAAAALMLGTGMNTQAVKAEEDKPTLTVWAYWTNSDLYSDQGDWEYWQAIEEACNVNLEFLDSSGGKDALSLLAGTDDLPDIIIDYDGTFPGGVQKMLMDGSIISLNELMDNGSLPNFKAYYKVLHI